LKWKVKDVRELTLHVQCVFKAGPFVLGKKATEVGNANVIGLVGADALHGIGIIHGECESSRRIGLKTGCGCSKILWNVGEKVKVSKISNDRIIVIEAAIIRSQCIVFSAAFGNDNHVICRREVGQGGIGSLLEACSKEPKCPIDLTVLYPGL
jgi:hypothetical protein